MSDQLATIPPPGKKNSGAKRESLSVGKKTILNYPNVDSTLDH